MIWTLYSRREKLIHKGGGHYLFLIKMTDKESTTVQELMEIQTQIFSNKNIGNCYKYLKVETKCDYFSLWSDVCFSNKENANIKCYLCFPR